MLQLLAESPAILIAVALLLGLVIGSFLNVVIYRLPIMLDRQWRRDCAELSATPVPVATPERFDLVLPRSSCPACRAPIRALHNVPVVSYLALRGRCAACGARIGPRYPLVELLCGVLSAGVVMRFGFDAEAACALLVTWFLLALTFIDLDHQLLPDSLTLPLLWAGLLASLTGWASPEHTVPVDPVSAIGGAALGYVSLWAVYHLFRLATGKEGMGYGDFKLLAALGAWLGWRMLLPIVLLAALVGAVAGVALIVARRHQRGAPIPFGPFLAAAGWIALMWGPQLVSHYMALYGVPGA